MILLAFRWFTFCTLLNPTCALSTFALLRSRALSGVFPAFNLVFSVEDSLLFTFVCAPVGVSAPIPLADTWPVPALLSVPSALIEILLFLSEVGTALAVLYAVPPSKLN